MTTVLVVMSPDSEVSDLRIRGTIDPLPTHLSAGIRVADRTTISSLWMESCAYGIDCYDCEQVALNNTHFEHIHGERGWGACIHISTGAHNIRIDGFEANDCDRGIETENGACDVRAINGQLTDVRVDGEYSFALDVHTHIGAGGVKNVHYENFTLLRCEGLTLLGGPDADRSSNLSLRNITIIDPIPYHEGVVTVARADHVRGENIRIVNLPAGKVPYTVFDSTDVELDITVE